LRGVGGRAGRAHQARGNRQVSGVRLIDCQVEH